MDELNVKIIKLRENAILPSYQTKQAAGMDLHACIDAPITLQPLERKMIPTGIAIELPSGYEAQVRARSGMSIKHGITMVNGVGTVDADYRGEIGALVINLSDQPFTVEPDMRIAQMVVTRYSYVTWQLTDTINQTDRGDGGYGSTGINNS